MLVDFALTSFVTLFVVVDPIGLVPAFIAVTHGIPADFHRGIALRAAIIAAAVLVSMALGGNWLLTTLGISLSAFRISGGLLLFAVASEMVLGVRAGREARQAERAVEEHARNVAAYPLAVPLMAGPGAITATILIAGQAKETTAFLVLLAVIGAVLLSCILAFLLAGQLMRALGSVANIVVSRLLGLILAALAVQFTIDGIRTAFGHG